MVFLATKIPNMTIQKPGDKTIIIPIDETKYLSTIKDSKQFKQILWELIARYPELFPTPIQEGFIWKGWSKPSTKFDIARRQIRLISTGEQYLIHPCFVFPYLRGYTTDLSFGLELRKYNVPYDQIARNEGQDAMYWYRAEMALAQNSIVGTTIKDPKRLPKHLLIDEHHGYLLKDKIYTCTTIGNDCFLGAQVAPSIEYDMLYQAYSVCKRELVQLCPGYNPLTINSDGFRSTVKVIETLYPHSQAILCFLHGFFKIKKAATKEQESIASTIFNKVWECYYCENKRSFAQKIRFLAEWTHRFVPPGAFKDAILKLCEKKNFIWWHSILKIVVKPQIC